ncbi:MAG: thioredoxin domain-containing protein [Pseudomonadota bacterium]|nr:thioredoxin domain-containing protein [Pseudomonadota bacterium]
MMLRKSVILPIAMLMTLITLLGSSVPYAAMVDAGVSKNVPLAGMPKATVMSPDGKTVFVLTDGGEVAIFEPAGTLRGTIQVGAGSNDITVSPDGSRLYVTSGQQKTLKIVELDYIITLDTDNAPCKGPQDAPVVIAVFSDFQCPYCAKLNPILRQVLKKYPRQVKLVYKFLPLTSIHKDAMRAAIAALAAERQKKFWEYQDALLQSYRELSEARLVEIAKTIGLDMERFSRNRKDPRLVNRVREDMKEAGDNNIRSVPSVFINGRQLKSRSPKSFDRAINAELRRLGLQK